MSVFDNQVGGEHYKSCYQPIMYMADCKLNYIQGNVLKYITRYKKKNGLEDLKKAIQYCEFGYTLKFPRTAEYDVEKTTRYILENKLPEFYGYIIRCLCLGHYKAVKQEIEDIILNEYGEQ